MVKLRVAVRVISEDAYLASLRTGETGHVEGEKKFAVIVREPEDCYIGTLALDIQESYKRRYKYDLGKIKYLKANDDCDLDPEDLVADQLVDEGKAARDGADQNVTIKVIQEQGRAVRAGSVVPDLTPVHYQRRPLKPPVPLFSDAPSTLGKRNLTDLDTIPNGGHAKRVRMDGIAETEERDTIVTSIEGEEFGTTPELVIQDSQGHVRSPRAQGRQERVISPELGMPWQEIATATTVVDKLPEMPDSFREAARLAKTSPMPSKDSRANASQTPGKSPTDATVSMLNGMKSVSPVLGRSSSSASAARFRNLPGTVQVQPDPDIDDSQMSPRSRAAANKITPRLVSSTKRIAPSGEPNSPVPNTNIQQGVNEETADRQNQGQTLTAPRTSETDSENGSSIAENVSQEKETPSKLSRKRKRRSRKGADDDKRAASSNTALQEKGKKTAETNNTSQQKIVDEIIEREVSESSSDVDSPGAQLSQALQEYTPRTSERSISIKVPEEQSTTTKAITDTAKQKATATTVKSQDSKSAQKRQKPNATRFKCLTCWTDKTACDNEKPRCSSCVKRNRSCQEYALAMDQAEEIIKERKEQRAQNANKRKVEKEKLSIAGSKAAKKQLPEKPASTVPKDTHVVVDKLKPGSEGVSSIVPDLESSDKGKLAVPLNEQARRSQSTDSQGPRTVILPPGMTQQQYDEMVKQNSALTDEQRVEKKRSLQKKTTSLTLKKTPSRESEAVSVETSDSNRDKSTSESTSSTSDVSKKQAALNASGKIASSTPNRTPSVTPAETGKNVVKKNSSTKPIPSTASAQAATNKTPAAALSKRNSTPLTTTPSNRNNPPFKQPGLKSNKVAESVPLSNLKSVAELGARLSAQSSTANSPRPSINLGKNLAKAKNNNSSFLDNDDDDDDSDSESETESEEETSTSGSSEKPAAKTPEIKVSQLAPSPRKSGTAATTPSGRKTTLESSSSEDDSSTETASESSDDDDS